MRNETFIVIWLIFLPHASTNVLHAQSAKESFDSENYKDVISTYTKGYSEKSITDEDRARLGLSHIGLAEAYRAAFRFQVDAGAYLYERRASKETTVLSPYDPYFHGRYLYEAGRRGEAMEAFEEAAATTSVLPATFRRWAKVWQERSSAKAPTWDWPACARATTTKMDQWRCALLAYARGATEVYPIEELTALRENFAPDATQPIGDVERQFFDPATLYILSQVEFRAALEVLSSISSFELKEPVSLHASMAALALKEYGEAERLLRSVTSPRGKVYRGALYMELGKSDQAQTEWAAVSGFMNAVTYEWLSVASRYPAMQNEVNRILRQVEDSSVVSGWRAAHWLAIAYINRQLHEEAQSILDEHIDAESAKELDDYPPAVLLCYAHARFARGPENYALVNTQLHALLARYPELLGLVETAKAAMTPAEKKGHRASN